VSAAPTWLTVLAWTYLCACFACSALIAADITLGRRRQPMAIMNAVYPVTALYFGSLALTSTGTGPRARQDCAGQPHSGGRRRRAG